MKLPLQIHGIVTEGRHEGAKNGFPTANVPLSGKTESGIYAGKTEITGQKYLSAIYIGRESNILESHLLDFQGDLYGQMISVEIEKKIREDRVFKTPAELLKAIQADVQVVKDFYAKNA